MLLDDENITESLVSEGLASVRGRIPDDRKKLTELEEKAKLAQKNIWDESSKHLVRSTSIFIEKVLTSYFCSARPGLEGAAS